MREIIPNLQIDCRKKRCGKCHGVLLSSATCDVDWCKIYNKAIPINKKGKRMRLYDCLVDEVVDKVDEEKQEVNKELSHIIMGGV